MASVNVSVVAAEGSYLVGVTVHADLHHTELGSDRSRVRKELKHLVRKRARGYVDILWLPPQKMIPHPAPRKKSLMSVQTELLHNPLCGSSHFAMTLK